jgi:hypothetical protein
MPSTLYLFCQYFYWVGRLREELTFELFQTQSDKDAFFDKLRQVSDALGKWPFETCCAGEDQQVFTLQQRVLGEVVSLKQDGKRCMGYDEFKEAWEDSPLADHLLPLRALLEGLEDPQSCRWQRLTAVSAALDSLEEHCRFVLHLPTAATRAGTASEKASIE